MKPRNKLTELQLQRRQISRAERLELLNIPKSLVLLEQQMEELVLRLGTHDFLELTGVSGWSILDKYDFRFGSGQNPPLTICSHPDNRAKPLLAIQLVKAKLYEAKVGVVEAYWRAEWNTGTFFWLLYFD